MKVNLERCVVEWGWKLMLVKVKCLCQEGSKNDWWDDVYGSRENEIGRYIEIPGSNDQYRWMNGRTWKKSKGWGGLRNLLGFLCFLK